MVWYPKKRQFSGLKKIFATYVALLLTVATARVSLKYLSVVTIMHCFLCAGLGKAPRMSITRNTRGSYDGNNWSGHLCIGSSYWCSFLSESYIRRLPECPAIVEWCAGYKMLEWSVSSTASWMAPSTVHLLTRIPRLSTKNSNFECLTCGTAILTIVVVFPFELASFPWVIYPVFGLRSLGAKCFNFSGSPIHGHLLSQFRSRP